VNGRLGTHAECKECLKQKERKNRIANPEKKSIRDFIYREKLKYKYSDLKIPHHHVRMNERSIVGFEKYAEKKMQHLASNLLNYALRINIILKPDKCSMCNKKGVIEGHHNDYSKPLQVAWVCKNCHTKFHEKK
jgi:hypothetical protein